MRVKSNLLKRCVSEQDKYIEHDGVRLCKPVFSDINIYKKHGIKFVYFRWDTRSSSHEVILTQDDMLALGSNFDRAAVLNASSQIIEHFDNFTVIYKLPTSELTIYNAQGQVEKKVQACYFTKSSADIGFKDSDTNQHRIVLNGEKIEEFVMAAGAPGFIDPKNFIFCYKNGWTKEALDAEIKYLKALVKNDLRNWDKRTEKYKAYFAEIRHERVILVKNHGSKSKDKIVG